MQVNSSAGAAGVVGTCVALVAGLVAVAPSAHAAYYSGQEVLTMTSTPAVTYEQRALSTGASAEPLLHADLPRLSGDTRFRATFGAGVGSTIDGFEIQVVRCTSATDASTCNQVEHTKGPNARVLNSGLIITEDLDFTIDDASYGDILSGRIATDVLSNTTPAYLAVMRQPRSLLPPAMLRNGREAVEIDLAKNDITLSLPAWVNLPVTNERAQRLLRVWTCPSPAASQVQTYDWDSSSCSVLEEASSNRTAAREKGPNGYSNRVERPNLAGQYMIVEDTLSYGTLVNGGAKVTVRSAPYLLVDSEANQNQQNQQAQQNQGQQAQNQQNQNQQAQQNQGQQAQQAQPTAAALVQPTGRAARLLRVSQAPLVSASGIGTVADMTVTIDAPQAQARGKRKATYMTLTSPKMRGRVAMVLTRTTAKGKKMIVAKRTVRQTKKNGTAKIRWKMSTRMPAGTYTLYSSFIPKKRYGKPGLTVSTPVVIR